MEAFSHRVPTTTLFLGLAVAQLGWSAPPKELKGKLVSVNASEVVIDTGNGKSRSLANTAGIPAALLKQLPPNQRVTLQVEGGKAVSFLNPRLVTETSKLVEHAGWSRLGEFSHPRVSLVSRVLGKWIKSGTDVKFEALVYQGPNPSPQSQRGYVVAIRVQVALKLDRWVNGEFLPRGTLAWAEPNGRYLLAEVGVATPEGRGVSLPLTTRAAELEFETSKAGDLAAREAKRIETMREVGSAKENHLRALAAEAGLDLRGVGDVSALRQKVLDYLSRQGPDGLAKQLDRLVTLRNSSTASSLRGGLEALKRAKARIGPKKGR